MDRVPCDTHHLQWTLQSSTNQSIDLVQQIEDGRAWASVTINAGTTHRLKGIIQMIIDGNFSYNADDSRSSVTIIYDEGRNFNTINNFVLPRIRQAIALANLRLANYLQAQITTSSSNITQGTLIASIIFADTLRTPLRYD